MKPRNSKRLSKIELRKLRRQAEGLGIYPIDIAERHHCNPSAVSNFFNGDATSQPLLKTIRQMMEEASMEEASMEEASMGETPIEEAPTDIENGKHE